MSETVSIAAETNEHDAAIAETQAAAAVEIAEAQAEAVAAVAESEATEWRSHLNNLQTSLEGERRATETVLNALQTEHATMAAQLAEIQDQMALLILSQPAPEPEPPTNPEPSPAAADLPEVEQTPEPEEPKPPERKRAHRWI